MKLTKHSKKRMRQRTDFNHKERRHLFREALDNGKSPHEIKDEKLKQYLKSRVRCKTKVYKGYIFIYGKNSKILYTMYPIPEYLKEGE